MGFTKFKLLAERLLSGLGRSKTFFPFYDSQNDADYRVSLDTLITFISNELGVSSKAVFELTGISNTGNNYVSTLSINSYKTESLWIFKPSNDSDDVSTLNVDSKGALQIKEFNGTNIVDKTDLKSVNTYLLLNKTSYWLVVGGVSGEHSNPTSYLAHATVDGVYGDDSYAQLNNPKRPYRTINVAMDALKYAIITSISSPVQCRAFCHVKQGVYFDEYTINREYVDMHFDYGAIVISDTDGKPVISDTDGNDEPVNINITGQGQFYHTRYNPQGLDNQAIALSNASSREFNFEAYEIDGIQIYGSNSITTKLNVKNTRIRYTIFVGNKKSIHFEKCKFLSGLDLDSFFHDDNEITCNECEFIVPSDNLDSLVEIRDLSNNLIDTIDVSSGVQSGEPFQFSSGTRLELQNSHVGGHYHPIISGIYLSNIYLDGHGNPSINSRYSITNSKIRIQKDGGVGIFLNQTNEVNLSSSISPNWIFRDIQIEDETVNKTTTALVAKKRDTLSTTIPYMFASIISNCEVTIGSGYEAGYIPIEPSYGFVPEGSIPISIVQSVQTQIGWNSEIDNSDPTNPKVPPRALPCTVDLVQTNNWADFTIRTMQGITDGVNCLFVGQSTLSENGWYGWNGSSWVLFDVLNVNPLNFANEYNRIYSPLRGDNIGKAYWRNRTGNTPYYQSIGGNGVTNLGYTPSPTNGIVTSDTGTDATIPLADGTNAGLSLNDYTSAEKSKLNGIAAGAEVNVNADWNAVSGDAQILNKPTISGSNTGDQTITLTGDVAGSGTGSFTTTIANNVVSNSKLDQMAANTIKGNNTGSTANAADLTTDQFTAMMENATAVGNSGIITAITSATYKYIRLNNAGATGLGSILAPSSSYKDLYIWNDTGVTLTLYHNYSGEATAANRIICGANRSWANNTMLHLKYSVDEARWCTVAQDGNTFRALLAGTGDRLVQASATGQESATLITQDIDFTPAQKTSATTGSWTGVKEITITGLKQGQYYADIAGGFNYQCHVNDKCNRTPNVNLTPITTNLIYPLNEITATSGTLIGDNSYILNNASQVVMALPATGVQGDVITISGKGVGGWRVTVPNTQQIVGGLTNTLTNGSGYIQAGQYASVTLKCITGGTAAVWEIICINPATTLTII